MTSKELDVCISIFYKFCLNPHVVCANCHFHDGDYCTISNRGCKCTYLGEPPFEADVEEYIKKRLAEEQAHA